jgi:hypothetical protein
MENKIVMSASSAVLFNLTMTMTIKSSSSIIISILIGISLSFIALITALGNIVVLLAFYCDNKLRTNNGKYIEYFKQIFFFSLKKIILY